MVCTCRKFTIAVFYTRGWFDANTAILAKRNGVVSALINRSKNEGTSRDDGGTSFANTNKVPFFRHSVRLSPSDGALARAYFRASRKCTLVRATRARTRVHALFHAGASKTYLPFPAGQAP